MFDVPVPCLASFGTHLLHYRGVHQDHGGECQYHGDSNRTIGRRHENDNPVRKLYICSSIITLMFGSDMDLEKLEKPAKRLFFVVVSQGNSGNIRE